MLKILITFVALSGALFDEPEVMSRLPPSPQHSLLESSDSSDAEETVTVSPPVRQTTPPPPRAQRMPPSIKKMHAFEKNSLRRKMRRRTRIIPVSKIFHPCQPSTVCVETTKKFNLLDPPPKATSPLKIIRKRCEAIRLKMNPAAQRSEPSKVESLAATPASKRSFKTDESSEQSKRFDRGQERSTKQVRFNLPEPYKSLDRATVEPRASKRSFRYESSEPSKRFCWTADWRNRQETSRTPEPVSPLDCLPFLEPNEEPRYEENQMCRPVFYHTDVMTVLTISGQSYTISNGVTYNTIDDSLIFRTLICRDLRRMNVGRLYATDQETMRKFRDMNTGFGIVPIHNIRYAGICYYCEDECCHRWTCVMGGVQKLLNTKMKPIEHSPKARVQRCLQEGFHSRPEMYRSATGGPIP